MSEANELMKNVSREFNLQLQEQVSGEQILRTLAERINHLITTDFNELLRVLYRLDVSEPKLKQLLKEHPDADAGKLIAQLIVERQVQKQKSRQQFRQRDETIPDDEKW
jgi:hypothetical protein